jgi:meso-butanediol dehydrogenase/(S,S)-butanediol dehydrogenase/diacetyl reductase
VANKALAGKAVLVTGAASGIGRATALRMGEEGAALVLGDLDLPGADTVAADIRAAGGQVTALAFDAADPASCRDLVDRAAENLGRLDVLANIAGVLARGPFEDCAPADWDRVIAINLTSYFHTCQRALPHLLATSGNIVNMASSAALRGVAMAVAYSASKHGVVGLTKSLAAEFKDRGVRVNAICPGPIDTPMIQAHKPPPGSGVAFGEPEDIAAAVVYLAGDEARFVNGAILSVDGGQMASGR